MAAWLLLHCPAVPIPAGMHDCYARLGLQSVQPQWSLQHRQLKNNPFVDPLALFSPPAGPSARSCGSRESRRRLSVTAANLHCVSSRRRLPCA